MVVKKIPDRLLDQLMWAFFVRRSTQPHNKCPPLPQNDPKWVLTLLTDGFMRVPLLPHW